MTFYIPQQLKNTVNAIGYTLELDGRTLLLKIPHAWEHKDIKLVLTYKNHPYCFVLEFAVHATGGCKQ